MVSTVLIMAGIFGLFYILYLNGIIALTTKRSIMFIGSLNGKKARFTQCSGTLRRIVRFKESRNYYFMLDSMLTSGAMDIELLDSKNNQIMKLDAFLKSKSVYVEEKEKYYLLIRFHKATGSYEFDWE